VSDVTRILDRVEQGDPKAANQLLPLVYEELRKIAAAKTNEIKNALHRQEGGARRGRVAPCVPAVEAGAPLTKSGARGVTRP
jgi:hypothetical protein